MGVFDAIKDMVVGAFGGSENAPVYAENEQAADHQRILTEMDELRRECQSVWAMNLDGRALEDVWEDNARRWNGDHWGDSIASAGTRDAREGSRLATYRETSGLLKMSLNRTQSAMVSGWAVETEKLTTVYIEPRESGDRAEWYIDPDYAPILQQMEQTGKLGVDALGQPMILQGFTAEQKAGLEPLNEQNYDTLVKTLKIPEKYLLAVNDKTVADMAHNTLQAKWEDCGADQKVMEYVLRRNITGHSWASEDWDKEKMGFRITNWPFRDVWCDSTKSCVEDMAWLGTEEYLDVAKAKLLWPEYAAKMDQWATRTAGHGEDYRGSSANRGTDFARKMLKVWTFYRRYEPYPMTEDEAIRAGKVAREQQQVLDEFGVTSLDETGAPQMRDFLVLAETGEEVTPESPKWPKVSGVRHLVGLPDARVIVEDHRCEYLDIPFALNKALPIIDTPYGQGDPQRLEAIQQMINRLATYIVNILRMHAFPPEMWPQSILEALKAGGYTGANIKPMRKIGIPDHLWEKMAAAGTPALSVKLVSDVASFLQLLQFALAEHDRLSGHVDVMQGRVQPGTSGVAIAQLQEAAKGPVGLKAKYTEWAVERLAKLALDSLVKWLPTSEWAKYNGRYARPVQTAEGTVYPALEAMIGKLQKLDLNIRVEVAAGRGLDRQIKAQMSLEARKMQDLSRQKFLEANPGLTDDPTEENRRIVNEKVEEAKAMQEMQQEAQMTQMQAQQPVATP